MDLLDVPERHPPRGALTVVYSHLPRVSRIFSPDGPHLFRLISALVSQEVQVARVWDGFMLHECFNQTPLLSGPATSYVSCCFFLAPSSFKNIVSLCRKLSQWFITSLTTALTLHAVVFVYRDVTNLSHLMAVSEKPPAWLLSVSSPRYSRHYWKTSVGPL